MKDGQQVGHDPTVNPGLGKGKGRFPKAADPGITGSPHWSAFLGLNTILKTSIILDHSVFQEVPTPASPCYCGNQLLFLPIPWEPFFSNEEFYTNCYFKTVNRKG